MNAQLQIQMIYFRSRVLRGIVQIVTHQKTVKIAVIYTGMCIVTPDINNKQSQPFKIP